MAEPIVRVCVICGFQSLLSWNPPFNADEVPGMLVFIRFQSLLSWNPPFNHRFRHAAEEAMVQGLNSLGWVHWAMLLGYASVLALEADVPFQFVHAGNQLLNQAGRHLKRRTS